MSRFFNPDNPIMEFIAKIFDLILLNLIFIFSCVPIITIGASTSALSYSMVLCRLQCIRYAP